MQEAELLDYTPDVVIAKEFQYHRSCYKNITRSKQSDDSNTVENKAREKYFRLLIEFVNEKIIQQGEVLRMITLADQYKRLQLSNGLEIKGCINKNLKARLVSAFEDELSYVKRNETTAEIVYGSRDNAVLLSDEEKAKEIAKLIKDEIMLSVEGFIWHLNPEAIKDADVKIPKLLETFLKTLFSKESPILDKVQRLIKSIGQDIL